jgi:hypothetical protein
MPQSHTNAKEKFQMKTRFGQKKQLVSILILAENKWRVLQSAGKAIFIAS